MRALLFISSLFLPATALAESEISFNSYIAVTGGIVAICIGIFGFIMKHWKSKSLTDMEKQFQTSLTGLERQFQLAFQDLKELLSEYKHTVSTASSSIERVERDLHDHISQTDRRFSALEGERSSCQNRRREFETTIQVEIQKSLASLSETVSEVRGAVDRLQEGTSHGFAAQKSAIKAEILEELLRRLPLHNTLPPIG